MGPKSFTRGALLCVIALGLAVPAGAGATSLTPGDVVVERDGNGTEALNSSAESVWLNEFEPSGAFATALALPTSVSGSNKRLVDSGSSTSDGQLTLAGKGGCVLTAGYNAALGTANVTSKPSSSVARTVAVIKGDGTINTTTALTNAFNENNVRGATSDDCSTLWASGTGKNNTGGVWKAALGASTGTQLSTTVTNVRQVEVAGGQLYASADPTNTSSGGVTIAGVGTGLPTSEGQSFSNLAFATAPKQPFAYSFLTLGLGTGPDTLYVADNERGAVVKYGRNGENKWVEHGSVAIPEVTGVTANDVNSSGVVTIYATSSAETANGPAGKAGTLYRIDDFSGVNGTLSGAPQEIAQAPVNEAYRGVAFAPGTVIGSGGTAPAAPSIHAAEEDLPVALGDPTMQSSVGITVEDPEYASDKLTVRVASSNEAVAPVSGIKVTPTGRERTVTIAPGTVGISTLTLTVEAPNGVFASTRVFYGVSENQGSESDRYYSGAADSGGSIDVGGGYMIVAGDSSNVLRLYRERVSGPPVKTWNFNEDLPFGSTEVNIHSVARAGNTLYFVGGMANTNSGEPRPARDTVFAATITGSGASTNLTYLGSYSHLREDLIGWDEEHNNQLGLAASAALGERANGFKLQGLEFVLGSSTEAYVSFRAPLEPKEGPEARTRALVIPVTNFSSLVSGVPGTHATFGTPLEWNLGGNLSIRQIRKNAEGEYLVIAGTPNSSDTVYQLWGWDGEPEDEPVLLNTSIPLVEGGVWDTITATPEPFIVNNAEAELLQDDEKALWYGGVTKNAENGLIEGLQKSLGRLISMKIPAPGTPKPPHLSQGVTPNQGQFTLRWKPAPTLRARFTLEHQNAIQKTKGEWSTVAPAPTHREYTFGSGNPESEGTWAYRVKEINETGEAGPSNESEAIKVDRTPPNTPTATADRKPDYAGKGGWYRDTVTVTSTSNGDPTLKDGSEPSGVDSSTLTAPQTFNASGKYTASGTVADFAGNVSSPATLEVQVDATAPTLEVTCPETALVAESGVHATVAASDGESGLAKDPTGTVPIDTTQTGPETVTSTAIDNVGHETTRSCTTQVVYPTPGAPKLTAGANPNASGLFTLGWSGADPVTYPTLTYTLQHHNAATATWSNVESGIGALSYEFTGAGEGEGTWVYQVQGSDPIHGQLTKYSDASKPVVVDKSPPFPPSAEASREPDYAGNGGWYKNSVEVLFTSNGDKPLSDGSAGSGVDPATIPPPSSVNTSGSHNVCGRVTDNVGNVSAKDCLIVQVEASPPSLEIECPATTLVGSDASAKVTASDPYSGLSVDPSGTVPIDTSHPGEQTTTRTAVSNLGFETTKSCTTMVESSTPGAPALTTGTTPNRTGRFTLGWSGPDPLQYFGLSYKLQHHDAATSTWSTVANNIGERSYEFAGGGEEEGTWVYRVQGTDPSIGLTSEYSPASEPVVVDRTPPNTPTAEASRAPDYAGKAGWYKDGVNVSFTSHGDPNLADGSPGSGVEPASLTAPESFSTSGAHTASGTVADNAGNVSTVQLVLQVDATPPSLEVKCPATATVGEAGVSATVTASDAESGLAVDPSGSVPISTERAANVTVTRTAVDNVGHEVTRSCTTKVLGSPPEIGRCVKAPSERVGTKTIYHGFFTSSTCVTKNSTASSPYEWESGAIKTGYQTAIKPSTTITFETIKKTKMTCLGETGSGTITSAKTVGGVTMRFTECQAGLQKCTTPGHVEGELETKKLEGVLGFELVTPEKRYVGLDLYPVGKTGAFIEYVCGEHAPTTLSGSVIGRAPADKMFTIGLFKYSQSAGLQKPEKFEGGAKEVLTNNHGEQVGLSASINQTNPEALELNAYF